MTDAEKLTVIKTLLDDGGEMPSDEKLNTYIQIAGQEILAWKYHLIGGVPDDVTEVPAAEDITHIYAVVAGYTHAGSEGEKQHNENSVNRVFIYADMVDYIRNNVLPYVRVGAVT
jgi:hypothetical protein